MAVTWWIRGDAHGILANDGFNDCEDNCPNQSDPKSNSGCPEQGVPFCLGTGLLAVLAVIGGVCASMKQK